MGIFRQISTELWPSIYVKTLFPVSIEHLLAELLQNVV